MVNWRGRCLEVGVLFLFCFLWGQSRESMWREWLKRRRPVHKPRASSEAVSTTSSEKDSEAGSVVEGVKLSCPPWIGWASHWRGQNFRKILCFWTSHFNCLSLLSLPAFFFMYTYLSFCWYCVPVEMSVWSLESRVKSHGLQDSCLDDWLHCFFWKLHGTLVVWKSLAWKGAWDFSSFILCGSLPFE